MCSDLPDTVPDGVDFGSEAAVDLGAAWEADSVDSAVVVADSAVAAPRAVGSGFGKQGAMKRR